MTLPIMPATHQAMDTLDEACNTLLFLSDALTSWDTRHIEFSENSAHQISLLLFNVHQRLETTRETLLISERGYLP